MFCRLCFLTLLKGAWWPHIFGLYREMIDGNRVKIHNNVQEQRHGILRSELELLSLAKKPDLPDFCEKMIKIIKKHMMAIPGLISIKENQNLRSYFKSYSIVSNYKKDRYFRSKSAITDPTIHELQCTDIFNELLKIYQSIDHRLDQQLIYQHLSIHVPDMHESDFECMIRGEHWADSKSKVDEVHAYVAKLNKISDTDKIILMFTECLHCDDI